MVGGELDGSDHDDFRSRNETRTPIKSSLSFNPMSSGAGGALKTAYLCRCMTTFCRLTRYENRPGSFP